MDTSERLNQLREYKQNGRRGTLVVQLITDNGSGRVCVQPLYDTWSRQSLPPRRRWVNRSRLRALSSFEAAMISEGHMRGVSDAPR